MSIPASVVMTNEMLSPKDATENIDRFTDQRRSRNEQVENSIYKARNQSKTVQHTPRDITEQKMSENLGS